MAERKVTTQRVRMRLGLASDEWLVALVRRGDIDAFETLYDRHARELLGFCTYMLSSRPDAEDAVQATFASAYRALRADSRPIALRPWLFTIARNECLSTLRRRRPVVELTGEVAAGGGPADHLELNEEVRRVFEGLRDLPETQRAALVLAEVHGLSHREVGRVLGVRPEQVKAFVYQARAKLLSDRAARDADCREIREELAAARGASLLRGRLRRHMRSCPDCRSYADGVARQRRQLGALLPLVPSLAFKYRALEEALNLGGAPDPATAAGGAVAGATFAGTAAEVAGGGGAGALVCKVAAGVACLGASAGIGVSVLSSPEAGSAHTSTVTMASAAAPLVAAATTPRSKVAPAAPSPRSGGGAGRRPLRGGAAERGTPGRAPVSAPAAPPPRTRGDAIRLKNYASAGNAEEQPASGGEEAEPPTVPGGGRPPDAGEDGSPGEHRAQEEQRQTLREGHRQYLEQVRRQHEQHKAEREAKVEAERARKQEEAAHEERTGPEGASGAPPETEEEQLARKQRAKERREERRREEEP